MGWVQRVLKEASVVRVRGDEIKSFTESKFGPKKYTWVPNEEGEIWENNVEKRIKVIVVKKKREAILKKKRPQESMRMRRLGERSAAEQYAARQRCLIEMPHQNRRGEILHSPMTHLWQLHVEN